MDGLKGMITYEEYKSYANTEGLKEWQIRSDYEFFLMLFDGSYSEEEILKNRRSAVVNDILFISNRFN